jgi:flagellar hook-length control protein FliK
MTGPLLFGPAQAQPAGVPAPAQRPAQSLRRDASDFAGSLRSATQRREPTPTAPESRDAISTPDEAPSADHAEESTAGDAEVAPTDEQAERAPTDDEEPVDDGGDAPGERPDAAKDAVATAVAGAQRATNGEADLSAESEGEPADDAERRVDRRAAPAIAGRAAGGASGSEIAGEGQASESTRAATVATTVRAEPTGPQQPGTNAQVGAAGSNGSIVTGDDAGATGEQAADQRAGQQGGAHAPTAETRPESTGAFAQAAEESGARRAAEAAPPDEPAPVRAQAPSPTHTTGEGARPQTLRLESVATPSPSAGTAGQGAEAADDSAAMQAVHRGLGAAVRQRGGSITIRLSPESMGQVRIEMTIRQGTVDVRIEASTDQARELLTRHADMLRSTLQQKGFGVERIDVHANPAPTNGSRAGADASADQQQRRSPEQDAAGGESRGAFGERGDDRRGENRRHDDEAQSFEQWRVRVNATA